MDRNDEQEDGSKTEDEKKMCHFCKIHCKRKDRCMACKRRFCKGCPSPGEAWPDIDYDGLRVCKWCIVKGCRKMIRIKKENRNKSQSQMELQKNRTLERRKQEYLRNKTKRKESSIEY